MNDQYRLVGLANSELLAGLSDLVRQSNELTAGVLAHLVELEVRLLHLELGFSSLFAYCVEGLGMSEGAAGRRVAAARVCRRFPEVFERVARGRLHLCALCALASHLSEENAVELFDTCEGRTRRQIEELVAVRFPRPDVRAQIRRLPTRGETQPSAVAQPLPPPRLLDSLGDLQSGEVPTSPAVGAERGESAANLATPRVGPPGLDARPRARGRELEPLSAERFGVHFTADVELRELIERAGALGSHRVPNGELAGLMKLVLTSFVKQEEKRRFGIGTRPRRSSSEAKPAGPVEPPAPPGGVGAQLRSDETPIRGAYSGKPAKRTRHVAAQVRRETHARDGGQCAFVSPDGRRCSARALLEFDHLEPFARFGAAEASNMRLLCKAHNLLHARHCFGAMHVAAKIAARNRTESGPRVR